MQQNDLNRAVARATGETVSTVKRLGFLMDDADDCTDRDIEVIDWDELEARRYAALSATRLAEAAAA